MLGRARFVALYLLSALGGSVVLPAAGQPRPVAASPTGSYGHCGVTGAVGASGAVFGLFGALLVLSRHARPVLGRHVRDIAINAVIGFVIPGIAWQAHLGGLLTGAAVAAAIAYSRPRPRRRWQPPAEPARCTGSRWAASCSCSSC